MYMPRSHRYLRYHMGSGGYSQLQGGEKISSNLMTNLSIHFSRGNSKCMNDKSTMFNDRLISQLNVNLIFKSHMFVIELYDYL